MRRSPSRGANPSESTSASHSMRRSRPPPSSTRTARTCRVPSAPVTRPPRMIVATWSGTPPASSSGTTAATTSTPASASVAHVIDALGRVGGDDRPAARTNAVHGRETHRAAAQPDAGKIVAGEDLVRFDGAGRHDDPARVHAQERAVAHEGNERTLVDAERRVSLEDRHGPPLQIAGETTEAVEHGSRGDLSPRRPSSHTITASPRSDASIAAASPATPPPITSTSVRMEVVAANAGGRPTGSLPTPVARRINRSAMGQANRGRTKVL